MAIKIHAQSWECHESSWKWDSIDGHTAKVYKDSSTVQAIRKFRTMKSFFRGNWTKYKYMYNKLHMAWNIKEQWGDMSGYKPASGSA